MRVARVAALSQSEFINEHKVASTRNVEDWTRDLRSFLVQRKLVVKSDLIQRLVRWPECLVNLSRDKGVKEKECNSRKDELT